MIQGIVGVKLREKVIAVIDDNAAVLASLRFAMEAHGFKVRTYSSPLPFLDDLAEPPACLIIDYNMPGMSGLELVGRLRQAGNALPVLLTTGFLPPELAQAAALLDIEAIVPKPIGLHELLEFADKYC